MKFALRGSFRENVYNLMRKIGYHFQSEDKEKGEFIFTRPPRGYRGYPRFHLYLKVKNENLIFNLHLDQKGPIYKGVPAHAGEYDGELVSKEAKRIKGILNQ